MSIVNVGRAARPFALSALALGLAGTAGAEEGYFLEEDGLVVIEFESAHYSGDWVLEDDLAGHAGDGYLRWDGPDLFSQPGTDVFAFEFEATTGGVYAFRLHNRHEHPDSTEANDVWVRMDGGPWIKVFSGVRGEWTWATNHELSHSNKPPAEYTLTQGRHRIEFSGRSHDFMIDRMHLFHSTANDPYSLSHPESQRVVPNARPVARMSVSRAVPAQSTGTVVELDGRSSYDPDGDGITYEWQVRGGRFVQGTDADDPVVQVQVRGGLSLPVRLVVRDDDDEEPLRDVEYGVIDVEDAGATVHGALCTWHPMELRFEGPSTDETADQPNPFLDYRLQVRFTHFDGTVYEVPGFYAGDGEGGSAGSVWACRFTPDKPGLWTWQASFRVGEQVAIDLDPAAGQPSHFDGTVGKVGVLPRDPAAEGFHADGRVEYVGEHYLKQRDGGYFLKGGTNSPENFLAYAGFDDVQDNGGVGIIHTYAPHETDFDEGDPYFDNPTTGVDSRCIVGALNYLGDQGVNSIYFLPMNLGGDGQDTCPFVGYSNNTYDKTHYDLSRMAQWTQVLDHAQRKGILLHFVLAETESPNENWLDDGELGVERKLFYREMVARFGHALAVKWNLSEENDYSTDRLREFAAYIDAVDPYDHTLGVHTHPDDLSQYDALMADPHFDAASIQYTPGLGGQLATAIRNMTRNAGRKWVADMDENGHWDTGLSDSNADEMRRQVLWDVYFSGGQIEWYAGYHALPLGGDVRLEDFRTREQMWVYMGIAREFIQEHLPFWEMMPGDGLVSGESSLYGGAEVFVKNGDVFAVYLPEATQPFQLDLTNSPGRFSVRWFNPRVGEFKRSGPHVDGGQVATIDNVVYDTSGDWVVLIERLGL